MTNQNEKIVVSPKVIEKTAKGWGALSTSERTAHKAMLPLQDLYVAIVASCLEMNKFILRSNDEAEKSAAQDKRDLLNFYKARIEVETDEGIKIDLYHKIDKTSEELLSIYNRARKDRNKKYWGYVTFGVVTVISVALSQKRRS